MTEVVLQLLFPACAGAVACIPLLDSDLVTVDFTPYSLIIQHMLLRSYNICSSDPPQSHIAIGVLVLFVLSPCGSPWAISLADKFHCYLCNRGSCWCWDRMMKPSMCSHNFIYCYFFLPTPSPTVQQIRRCSDIFCEPQQGFLVLT